MTRLIAALVLSAAALAHAQYPPHFPQRPVRIIIGLGAGGVADAMTRTVTDKITFGQPFVLENRPGAGGNIAMEAVIKSAPDGHVLLLIGPALVINPALYPNLAFDPLKDLVTVSPVAIAPFALFASGTLPVSNVGELITLARSRPGEKPSRPTGVTAPKPSSTPVQAARSRPDLEAERTLTGSPRRHQCPPAAWNCST